MKRLAPKKLKVGMTVYAEQPVPARIWRKPKNGQYTLNLDAAQNTADLLDGQSFPLEMTVKRLNLPYVLVIHHDLVPVRMVVDVRDVKLYVR